MKILVKDEIDFREWERLAEASSNSSFFQTKQCYDFYCSLSFLEPFLLGVEQNNKLLALVCGYIIADGNLFKRFFSRRAIVPGGLLIHPDCTETEVSALLHNTIELLRKRVIFIEFRNYSDFGKYRNSFEKTGFKYKSHLNIQLKVDSLQDVFSNMSESKIRQIKQTEKAGVAYQEAKNENEIHFFYAQLSNLYKSKIKTPLFSEEFFLKIAKQPFSKFFIIKQNENILGGIICVFDKKKVYEWFVCGENMDKQKIYPSVYATWAGIKFSSDYGFKIFDFMGAGKPQKDYGVRNFKAKFGGTIVEHGRFLYKCSVLYYVGYCYINILKKFSYA